MKKYTLKPKKKNVHFHNSQEINYKATTIQQLENIACFQVYDKNLKDIH